MDINFTLIVQMIVFLVFVWFTMKFVWPPLEKAMEERKDRIADGLSAAERGRKELELAQHRIREELKQAKAQSQEIIDKASRRASQMIEEAKEDAKLEARKQARLAQEQLQQEINRARDTLRKQVAELAVAGAELILKREIDQQANSMLLEDLGKEI